MQIIWRMLLWYIAWRLAMHAGLTNNGWLLFMDIIFAYLLCVRWYPMFPYDQRSVDDEKV